MIISTTPARSSASSSSTRTTKSPTPFVSLISTGAKWSQKTKKSPSQLNPKKIRTNQVNLVHNLNDKPPWTTCSPTHKSCRHSVNLLLGWLLNRRNPHPIFVGRAGSPTWCPPTSKCTQVSETTSSLASESGVFSRTTNIQVRQRKSQIKSTWSGSGQSGPGQLSVPIPPWCSSMRWASLSGQSRDLGEPTPSLSTNIGGPVSAVRRTCLSI